MLYKFVNIYKMYGIYKLIICLTFKFI
jgi:hypothetical protein